MLTPNGWPPEQILPYPAEYARLGVAYDTPEFCPRFDPILYSAEPDFSVSELAPAVVGSTPFPLGDARWKARPLMGTRPMAKGRNPYRPGTASYARFREATLKRKAALARANAARAKTPETRRRAKQRATAAQRALRAIETREEFRSKLNEHDRAAFGRMPITRQERLMKIKREYPESVPKDLPDPFVGPQRNVLWRLNYSTRAGIRLRPTA